MVRVEKKEEEGGKGQERVEKLIGVFGERGLLFNFIIIVFYKQIIKYYHDLFLIHSN